MNVYGIVNVITISIYLWARFCWQWPSM